MLFRMSLMFVCVVFALCPARGQQAEYAPIVHRTEDVTFFSEALGAETSCTVVLPDPLVEGKRYPVVYMLHGYSGDNRDWADRTSFTLAMCDREMIAVMPNGGFAGWYVDSELKAGSRYESLVVKDLVPLIDKKYPTVARREGRAIGGLSMGGHGAVTLAAKHPDLFCSASSLSGVLNLPLWSGRLQTDDLLGKYDENRELWERNSAMGLADKFTSGNVALMFDCGTADPGCLRTARQFHEKLTSRGIRHTYNEYPGTHSWAYWGEHLPEHLTFHQNMMKDFMDGKQPEVGGFVRDRFHQLYIDRCLQFERETAAWLADKDAPRPIVLLGSSTLHGFKEKELMPGLPVVNRGISADRIGVVNARGVSHRLFNTVIALNPRVVIINNGTNDLGATSKSGVPKLREVSDEMHKVCETILEAVEDGIVILNSCHTTREKSAYIAPVQVQYNLIQKSIVKELNAKYPGRIFYADHATKVATEYGILDKQYAGDGLHLNRKGQEVMRDAFMVALEESGVLTEMKK